MATAQAAAPAGRRDIFTDFGVLDWAFLALCYVWILYFILQVGLLILRPGEFDFDFMPLLNGGLFIPIAWGATGVDRQMRNLIVDLDQGAVVVFKTDLERRRAMAAVSRRARRDGTIGAVLLVLAMVGGIASYTELLFGAEIRWSEGVIGYPGGDWTLDLFDIAIMTAVCVAVGGLGGRFLGRMVANGALLETLHDLGHDLSSFAGDSGTRTLRTIERGLDYSSKATVALTAVLAFWWIAFTMRFEIVSTYGDWRYPYLILWLISFGGFIWAVVVPVRAFRARLEAIYGGAQAQAEAKRQIALAREDIARLDERLGQATTRDERRRIERRRGDLDEFVAALQTRTLERRLLDRRFLAAWIVANVVAFTLPLVFANADADKARSTGPSLQRAAIAAPNPSGGL